MKRSVAVILVLLVAPCLYAGGMEIDYGPITLSSGQTARLQVVNSVDDPNLIDDPNIRRNVSVIVRTYAAFGDDTSRGTTRLRLLRADTQQATLGANEGASWEFSAAEGTRIQIVVIDNPNIRRGVEDPNIRSIEDPNIRATLEVRESSRTAFVLPGVIRGFNPQPDPPGHH